MGDQRAWLPQPELQLPEQALTLAHAQGGTMHLRQMMSEELPVPEVLGVAELPWGASQLLVDRVPLRWLEPPGILSMLPSV